MKSVGRVLMAGLLVLLPGGLRAQKQARLTQVVEQAVPPVAWPAPASIGYGTALDGAELDANSPVGGRFVYTPAAGAVLAPGQQTLRVAFEPSDPNYKAATAQVPLLVRSALGATFELKSWLTPGREVQWTPGDTLPLYVTPTGDFHQPITLSCVATGGYRCTSDQTLIRPVGVAFPVHVTITREVEQGPAPVRIPGGPAPALLVLAVVLGRKRLRGAALFVVLTGVMVGCGAGARKGVATVTATSLLETKQFVIQIVDSR